jgi:hypothetical protein
MMTRGQGSGDMGERRLQNIANRFPTPWTEATATAGLSNYQHRCDRKENGWRDERPELKVPRDSGQLMRKSERGIRLRVLST